MHFTRLAALSAALMLATSLSVRAQGTLRLAMSLADVPQTTGQPDQGAAGWRFTGVTLYDALVNWDISSSDRASTLTPGLATEWNRDPKDLKKWIFKLRRGVTFHDGSTFNADSVVWNLDKLIDKSAPQYDPKQVVQTVGKLSKVASYRKLDDYTVEITTTEPDSVFPYYLTIIWMSSPERWKSLGNSWEEFAKQPSGTGPWKLDKLRPRERAEMVPNAAYWNPARKPKLDRLVLLPMPDAQARTNVLLSGAVDFIELPAYDVIPSLKQRGFMVKSNTYPHTWGWWPNRMPGSPLNDVKVRRAINLAIDRDGILKMLGGYAAPAVGMVTPDSPWFGTPAFRIRRDINEAKRLMTEAGYGPQKHLPLKVLTSTSGSGQMAPIAMNEVIQLNLRDIWVDLDIEAVEFQTLRTRRAVGAQVPENKGIAAVNHAWSWADPDFAFFGLFESTRMAPKGSNWGNLNDPIVDSLSQQVRAAADSAQQEVLLRKLHQHLVDDAAWIFVAHDVAPTAMSAKVQGYVQSKNWIQDYSTIWMK